jgi:hypothetical protein
MNEWIKIEFPEKNGFIPKNSMLNIFICKKKNSMFTVYKTKMAYLKEWNAAFDKEIENQLNRQNNRKNNRKNKFKKIIF